MIESPLTPIRIVLVEPAGPRNVGAIARVMKNMGLQRLVLVNPQCDPHGDEARQMAVHAADVLKQCCIVTTLPDALVGCRRAVATTGRDQTITEVRLEPPSRALAWLVQGFPHVLQAGAVIFGREDRGLTNEELNYAQRWIRIPSSAAYPSLNLAQAVGICCYELYRMTLEEDGRQEAVTSIDPPELLAEELAPFNHLEGYYRQLEALLLTIGYLYPHTAASRMEKFRRLFNRARLTDREVAMLRGILSQMEWALQHPGAASNGPPQS